MVTLTKEQERALEKILKWFRAYKDDPYSVPQTLSLGGYAGTGKTTLIAKLREEINEPLAFLSLTGKAVAQIKNKIPRNHTVSYISTIHSFIYDAIINNKGEIIGWRKKEMEDNISSNSIEDKIPYVSLIINDEASMTSSDLNKDLLSYNKPILYVGDHGQLPPIRSKTNLMENPDIRLETPHRAALNNPITKLATMIRREEIEDIPVGYLDQSKDGYVSSIGALTKDIESLLMEGGKEVLAIVGMHYLRVKLNKAILKGLCKSTKEPDVGVRLVCLRNDRRLGIYNGMFGTVVRKESKDSDNFLLTINLDDNDRNITLPVAKYPFGKKYPKPPTSAFWKYGSLWDFGYFITCHKAQGSEASSVVVIGEGFGDKEMKKRWMYTAITRARKNLYLVKK